MLSVKRHENIHTKVEEKSETFKHRNIESCLTQFNSIQKIHFLSFKGVHRAHNNTSSRLVHCENKLIPMSMNKNLHAL